MMSPRFLALVLSASLGLRASEPQEPREGGRSLHQAPMLGLVQWRAWGPEVPELARKSGKLIYLYAGSRLSELSRATWQQSFSNTETADYLSNHFICVLVDLDEQGALASLLRGHLYQIRQAEGPPVHFWLTPDLRLVEASGYLPPTEEWGKPGFLKLAGQVSEAWLADPEGSGSKIAETLSQGFEAEAKEPLQLPSPEALKTALDKAADRLHARADQANGGFGEPPKQARPEVLRFLLTRPGKERDFALHTLRQLAGSSLRDPIDGGFFRYSTDAGWRLPCFQKLLSDQARLAIAYIEANSLQPDPVFREAARGALNYALNRLALPGGGYAFAEDGTEEHGAAAFLWTKAEIETALGAEAGNFLSRHAVTEEGNIGPDLDPGARLKGMNTLGSRLPLTAEDQTALATLDRLRKDRPQPTRDDRAFLVPQALLLQALSQAAWLLSEPRYRVAAVALESELRGFVTEGVTLKVRRMKGSGETAGPSDLAALALGLRAFATLTHSVPARTLSNKLLRKLLAEHLDASRGRFVVQPSAVRSGIFGVPVPALPDPCHAEALALLADLPDKEASLLRAGILERLSTDDPSDPGDLLLALARGL